MSKEPELVAYAAAASFSRTAPCSMERWKKEIEIFFNALGDGLKEYTIGHIKGILNMDNDSYCYFSNVGNKQGTSSKCEDKGEAAQGKLDFNVLLYGSSEEEVDTLVRKELEKLFLQLETKGSFGRVVK